MSIPSYTHHDIQAYERVINGLRVQELQTILGHFKAPKLGKKQELIARCLNHLRSPQHQHSVIKLLDDMNRRGDLRHMPYSFGSHSHSSSSHSHQNGHSSSYSNLNELYNRGGSTMYSASASASSSMQLRPVRNVRPVPLPFYDVVKTILEPVELSNPTGVRQQQSRNVFFTVPRELHNNIYQSDMKPLPRYELQLRFYYLADGFERRELPDDFPLNCVVKIDDMTVTLPNVIPSNKPNVEPKRPSRPVNITQYCQPPRDQNRPHKLFVEWTADRRVYAVGIYLVYRVHADILRDRAVANKAQRQSLESTKQLVIRRLGVGDDDGITMDQLKISLLCPLGKTRMGIPARCRDCTHLQCFDLDLFLKMNEKKPTWKCAVCSGEAPYHKIIIDEYFQAMLRDVSSGTTEVELLRDGGYKTIVEEAFDLSSDEDDSPARPATSSAPPKPAAPVAKKPVADDSIIVLDSDDDDDQSRSARSSIQKTPPRKEPEIVVIDDTPPRLTPIAAPVSRSNSTSIPSTSIVPPPPPPDSDLRGCSSGASTSTQQSPMMPNCISPPAPAPITPYSMAPQQMMYGKYSAPYQNPVTSYPNSIFNLSSTNGSPQYQPPGPMFFPQNSWRPDAQTSSANGNQMNSFIGRNMPNYSIQQQQPYSSYAPPQQADLSSLLHNIQTSFYPK